MNDWEVGDTLDELIAGPDHSFKDLHIVSCISFIIIISRNCTIICSSIQCHPTSKTNLNWPQTNSESGLSDDCSLVLYFPTNGNEMQSSSLCLLSLVKQPATLEAW